MKIGLISDTHGSLSAWNRALEVALDGSGLILHCGDTLNMVEHLGRPEGYDPEGLAAAINAGPTPVLIAAGNADDDNPTDLIRFPLQPYAYVQIEGLRILATHGHRVPFEELLALAERWGVGLLCTGHTHVPTIAHYGPVTHVNPGSTTYPLAEDARLHLPTCATWHDGQETIYDLETGTPISLIH